MKFAPASVGAVVLTSRYPIPRAKFQLTFALKLANKLCNTKVALGNCDN